MTQINSTVIYFGTTTVIMNANVGFVGEYSVSGVTRYINTTVEPAVIGAIKKCIDDNIEIAIKIDNKRR